MKHIIFDCDGTLINTSAPHFTLFAGIKELLISLSSENQLYVWTARGRASTMRILKELEVISYFREISTLDDEFPKPHIGGLRNLVGNAPRSSICVIGDSVVDMLGAKSFGVLAIGAIWNKSVRDETLKDAGADFLVSHPFECSKIIELNLRGDDHV